MNRHRADQVEDGLRGHAADWERDGSNVEFSGEDGLAELLDNVFESLPILSNHFCIVQWEPSIFMGLWMPKVIFHVFKWPPV